MTIWGNHSATQYPDLFHAEVGGKNAAELVGDQTGWTTTSSPPCSKRGAAIIEARGASSAASAANAAVDHMRDWVLGTPEGDWVSMAVPSDGSYGVPEGLISSFPVHCRGRRVRDRPGPGDQRLLPGQDRRQCRRTRRGTRCGTRAWPGRLIARTLLGRLTGGERSIVHTGVHRDPDPGADSRTRQSRRAPASDAAAPTPTSARRQHPRPVPSRSATSGPATHRRPIRRRSIPRRNTSRPASTRAHRPTAAILRPAVRTGLGQPTPNAYEQPPADPYTQPDASPYGGNPYAVNPYHGLRWLRLVRGGPDRASTSRARHGARNHRDGSSPASA